MKEKSSKNKNNNENTEAEQHNPFSGPYFAPSSNLNKGKSSPIPLTPIKIKEEYLHSDLMGEHRDHNIAVKAYESPFSYFCRDFAVSPAGPKFMSPNPLHSGLQYNYKYVFRFAWINYFSYGNVQTNPYSYSPLNERKESPAFRRNIKKIDFNSSNNINLNTQKDKVNIE